jgi:mannose-6-phosphate isomerase
MPPNIVDHYYRGGERLAALRGVGLPSPRRPEEWLAATVHRAGEPEVGLSRLVDGSSFATLVESDQVGWTGSAHGAPGAGPADTGILVKLLDAGQRLPVHVHPTRAFAYQHLHSCYGKTEAWYVLSVEGDDPAVWVGFREDVEPEELSARIEAQDSEWMLNHLNKISVRPGDGIVVPAGQPHATGAGVFVVEVQEPTDYSILLEWSVTTASREESHLDLGFEVALQAVDHQLTNPNRLAELSHHLDPSARSSELLRALPDSADPFFRVGLAAPAGDHPVAVPHGFAVAIVLDGHGELGWDEGGQTQQALGGQVYAVPAAIGDWTVSGDVTIAVCRPGTSWPDVRGEVTADMPTPAVNHP